MAILHKAGMKLILFDIDGTILDVAGAGRSSMLSAVQSICGHPIASDGYSMSGKTDTQIVLELFERSGTEREAAQPMLSHIFARYLQLLTPVLESVVPAVYPGIRALLQQLSCREDVVLGLLTGNVEPAAWLKLRRVSLDHHFCLGAFGEQAAERCLLPKIAVDKAHYLTGRHFTGKSVVIVGDTPNDILCGQHLGVKSVAVATGRFTAAQLAPYQADHLLEDFSEPQRVIELILS